MRRGQVRSGQVRFAQTGARRSVSHATTSASMNLLAVLAAAAEARDPGSVVDGAELGGSGC